VTMNLHRRVRREPLLDEGTRERRERRHHAAPIIVHPT
jgi:hypothetical protein